jgi:hypothetical protein
VDPPASGLAVWDGSAWGDPLRPAFLVQRRRRNLHDQDLGLTGDTLPSGPARPTTSTTLPTSIREPEYGLHTYTLAEKPTVQSVIVPATALLAQAGRPLSARGVQVRLTNDEIVKPDTVTCTLKLAGKTLPALGGGCKWKIPAAVAGKRGTPTLELTYQGESLSCSATPAPSRLPDGSADFVWGEDAWCYVADKPRLIHEAARIARGWNCRVHRLDRRTHTDERARG